MSALRSLLRIALVAGAIAGVRFGISAYRERQARHASMLYRIRSRLPLMRMKEPTLTEKITDLSRRGYAGVQRGAENLMDVASQRWAEDVFPMAKERSLQARERAFEFGGRTRESLGATLSKGVPTAEYLGKATDVISDVTNGMGKTMGPKVSDVKSTAGRMAGSAGHTLKRSSNRLVRMSLLIAAVGGFLVYLYAPEKEKQAKLWDAAKDSSRQIGRTFQDIREFVSDLRAESPQA